MKKLLNILFIITLAHSNSIIFTTQHFNSIQKSTLYRHVQKCVAEKQEQNFNLLKIELENSFDELIAKIEKENLLSIFKKRLSFYPTPQARQQAVVDIKKYLDKLQRQRDIKRINNLAGNIHDSFLKKSQ